MEVLVQLELCNLAVVDLIEVVIEMVQCNQGQRLDSLDGNNWLDKHILMKSKKKTGKNKNDRLIKIFNIRIYPK